MLHNSVLSGVDLEMLNGGGGGYTIRYTYVTIQGTDEGFPSRATSKVYVAGYVAYLVNLP